MKKSYYETFNKHPYEDHFDESNLLNINDYDNTIVLDLIDTFFSICYYDFYTKRNEESGKTLNLTIPVNNFEKFNEIKFILNNLLKFMTNGENWNVTFSKCEIKKKIQIPMQLSLPFSYNSIALLSGGLDALAGASQEKNNNTIFITYATNKIEKNKSINSYNNYISKYCLNSTHKIINKKVISKNTHLTQRTRTLIFLSSCFIYADYYNIKEIKIYENGIMTLNPTFYFRRKVTRTTHPKTIFYINEILRSLGLNFSIINPFNYLTKTEVLNLIPDEWNNLIRQTKTCSKMPGTKAFQNFNGSGICHCGICAACILRQISILNSSKNNFDVQYIVPENNSNYMIIHNYEKENGDSKKLDTINNFALYRYIEKRSLIQYYKLYKKNIQNSNIYKYLNLNPLYFSSDANYKDKYDRMLKKFATEIENYIQTLL